EDIPALARHFLARFAAEEGKPQVRGISAEALALLQAYTWPGNIRQLENTIRQIVVMNNGTAVTYDMLPHFIREASARARLGSDEARERRRPARGARPLAAIEPL
ncbi:MAG: sigma-54-dependent Fis family transcriptional regulator, partial [Pannonibacter indicus]